MLVGTPRSPPALGPGLVGEHPALVFFRDLFRSLSNDLSPSCAAGKLLPAGGGKASLGSPSAAPHAKPGAVVGPAGRRWWHATLRAPRHRAEPPLALVGIGRSRRSQRSASPPARSQLPQGPRNGGAGAAGRQAPETGLREREMPPAGRGTETLSQEQPETGNQYLEDALLQSYLRAQLPAQVGFGSACPGQPSGRGGTVARSPPVPPRVSPAAFQRSFELLVLEWAPG